MVVSSTVGAAAHANDPLRVRHLVVTLPYRRCHLVCDGARNNHDVCLPWRSPKDESEPVLIISWHRCMHHLNTTARQSKREGPQRRLTSPVDQCVERRPACISIYSSLNGYHETYSAYSAADESSFPEFTDSIGLFDEVVTHLVDATDMFDCAMLFSGCANNDGEETVIQGTKKCDPVLQMRLLSAGHERTLVLVFRIVMY